MGEPLHRIADAVADTTESNAVAALTSLGFQQGRAAAGEGDTENAAAAAWYPFGHLVGRGVGVRMESGLR
ncbi:hypothetical protein RGQ21_51380 [Kitasatospora aureofaciens]|nr:hypothetical protein RGQ21_51380 [Kitasatospora aureofaciens]